MFGVLIYYVTTDVCPDCDGEYQRVAGHVSRSDCEWPELSDYQVELLTGLMLGDGGLIRRTDRNPYYKLKMANEQFVNWVGDELGWLTSSVRLEVTGDELNERHGMENAQDQYRLQTKAISELDGTFGDWYTDDGKRYPDNLSLTPMKAKLWYVADGSVDRQATRDNRRATVVIGCSNEVDRPGMVESLFSDVGFHPSMARSGLLRFPTAEAKNVLEWMGEPLPGFEHKWQL